MSPCKPNATYAASERQYTVAVREVQVPRGGSLFASDGRWSEEIDTRISKANAVLREVDRSVITKWELSSTAKLSIFKSVFVPILTNGHEYWVITERILTQAQASEMGFLRRLHGVTQGRTEVRWRPGKEKKKKIPYSYLRSFGNKCTVLNKKLETFLGLSGAPSGSAPGAF